MLRRVPAGELHWDFELFRILPELLAATDVDAGRDVLVEWLDRLGEPPACDRCAAMPEEMHVAPALDWLNDQHLLGTGLSARLQRIHQRRPADAGQYFVNMSAGAGIPDFLCEPAFTDRVAVLVDESTVSHAEYTAMALQTAPGAIVVGSRTRGANGNVARFPLPGGLSVAMSSIGAYYADKTPMQRVGIIADVPAEPSIEGFRAGRDEVLEAALAELLGAEASSAAIREMARFRPD